MGDHLVKHGDGVKDVAFTVQDCDFLVQVKPQVLISRCILSYVSNTQLLVINALKINIFTYTMHSPYILLHRKPASEVQSL